MNIEFAQWPLGEHIVAGVSLRGVSVDGVFQSSYLANNMSLHVGDDPCQVMKNRQALNQHLPGNKHWYWLNQVHGSNVVKAPMQSVPMADAVYTYQPNTVCAVLTADCLPILLVNPIAQQVAAIHCGWRSLCAGIIEKTLSCLSLPAEQWFAWFGPAIGSNAFEVGRDVYDAFLVAAYGERSSAAFSKIDDDKYLANIYDLARIRLNAKGVTEIFGDSACTVAEAQKYYSYRRDGVTGRMASFIYFLD